MALQIWLPLNGDLHNQGLISDVTVSNTPSYTNSGKIGKALSTGSFYLTAEQTNKLLNNDYFSICFWVYINADAGTYHYNPFFGNDNMGSPNNRRYTVFHYPTVNQLHLSWQNYDGNDAKIEYLSGTDIFPSYQWTHIAVTYNNSKREVRIYKNGSLYHTISNAYQFTSPNYSYQTNLIWNDSTRYINDYRIYDHCLSPKEVKEISKGLVLHYKLDESSLKGSGNLVNGLNGGGQCTISGNTVSVSGNNSDTYFYIKTTQALTSGKTYKISCIGNFADGKYYYFPIGGQSNTGPGQLVVKNGYCSMVFVANNAIANAGTTIILDDTTRSPGAGTISNIMLEEIVGISDCSGYGRNGTITGRSVSINNISPRYKNNTLASDTSSYSIIGDNDFCLPDGPLTLSFWSKPTVSTTTDTSKIEFRFSKFYYFTYINYPYFTHDTDYRYKYTNYWSDDNWHYVTNVYDGSSLYLYIDGVLQSWTGSTTTSTAFQNELILKFRGNNLSDLRIYSTALSADDIKELYDTSAIIYNNGTVAAREAIETNNDNIDITKTGQVATKYFIECDDYLYLPAGTYVDTGLYYNNGDTCKAVTIIRYASGGSGRDLMGFSPSAGGYWGVTSGGVWEPHGSFYYTNSDITKLNNITYEYTALTSVAGDNGNYRVGCLGSGGYTVRNKYIYNVKLYKNGTLERDLYPAFSGSTCGLADALHGVFYTVTGSGALLGNDEAITARFYKDHIQLNQIIEI